MEIKEWSDPLVAPFFYGHGPGVFAANVADHQIRQRLRQAVQPLIVGAILKRENRQGWFAVLGLRRRSRSQQCRCHTHHQAQTDAPATKMKRD